MAHHRPWYKRNGAALIMATLGFPDSDTRWAYSCIIDMLNDRDRPLTDDAGFICGFTGLSRKKWAIVRRYLLNTESASGETFLYLNERGDLTNPRFERERAERQGEHERSVEAGRRGGLKSAAQRAGQTELDLTEGPVDSRARAHGETAKVGLKSPRKSADSGPDSPPNGPEKPARAPPENKHLAEPPPQPSRARQTPDSREEESSHPTPVTLSREERLRRVCELAGFRPVDDDQLRLALSHVDAWEREGISFEETVLPTVTRMIGESTERTRTLGRFGREIRAAHAHRKARTRNGTAVRHANPVLEPPDEAEEFRDLRRLLLDRMGPVVFAATVNLTRFERVEDAGGNRQPLRIRDERNVGRLLDTDHAPAVRAWAKAHGFTDVWGA